MAVQLLEDPPYHLLSLLVDLLQGFVAPEGGPSGRLLEGQQRRAELVPEASEHVGPALAGDALADLARPPGQVAVGAFREADQAAVVDQGLPGPARRREGGVGRPVPITRRNVFEPAAYPHPERALEFFQGAASLKSAPKLQNPHFPGDRGKARG